jgi:SNF2 family DNA or RNA helicase
MALAKIVHEPPNKLAVSFMYDAAIVEVIRTIDQRRTFDGDRKLWLLPCEEHCVRRLMDLFALSPEELPAEARRLLPAPSLPPPPDMSCLNGHQFVTQPYEHQRIGLAELLTHATWGLFWEMGSGKTKVACDWIRDCFDNEICKNVLIVCPKSVLSVWPKELVLHAHLQCVTLAGSPAKRREALSAIKAMVEVGSNLIVLANFDMLESHFADLDKIKWNAVIVDEAQNIKNSTTTRSKLARKLAKKSQFRYALSGTPAPNGPLDWFGTLLFLNPDVAGTESKVAFEAKYAIRKQLNNGARMVVGYQNLDDLNKRVASISSRIKKEQCLDLPPKVFITRKCELEGEQARVYAELKKDAMTRLQEAKEESTLTCNNVLTESLRLLQVAGGFVPTDLGKTHSFSDNAKMALLLEIMAELGKVPVVIWTNFRDENTAVAVAMDKIGRTVTAFHGGLNDAERQAAIKDFQDGTFNTFVATPQTGKEGISLTRASTEIYYSRDWNLSSWLQSQDRLHRIGQKAESVTIISLVAEETVDERVAEALDKKETLQEMMMARPLGDLL